jgi:hypothetical protein
MQNGILKIDSKLLNKPEQWKAIEEFEHYEVSSHGRYRSLPRRVKDKRWNRIRLFPGKILKAKVLNGKATAFIHANGTKYARQLDILVRKTFKN